MNRQISAWTRKHVPLFVTALMLLSALAPAAAQTTKTTLTVTADDQSRNYGESNPALTLTYSGFINGDTPASLTTQPAATVAATTASPPGVYPITTSGGRSDKYDFNYFAGALTVRVEGTGTDSDPYLVYNYATLNAIRNDLTAHYLVTADIDAGSAWIPIGDDSNYFTGTFNGNGHTITIDGFGTVSPAASSEVVGLFGGLKTGGLIQDVLITGSLSYSGSSTFCEIGGVLGENNGGTVQNCVVTADVAGTQTSYDLYVGGVVGWNSNSGTIQNCYSTGNVSADITSSGGYADAGGIVGYNGGSTVTVCYATGAVQATATSGTAYAGGIIGYNNGTTSNCVALNAGVTATGSSPYIGRVTGDNGGTLSNNYAFDISSIVAANSASDINGATIATAQAITQAAYQSGGAKFSFGTDDASPWVWGAFTDYTLPTLYWQTSAPPANGSVFSPYLVYNLADLNNVRNNLTAHYKVIADINAGTTWVPIGNDAAGFTGDFNGNGHAITINGIGTVTASNGNDEVGLFGTLDFGGMIRDVLVTGSLSYGSSNYCYIGGVLGLNDGGTVQNCVVTADVTCTSGTNIIYMGGVVGNNSSGTIQNCYTTGNVSTGNTTASLEVGGITGQNVGMVKACYATGTVSSSRGNFDSVIGGIVGRNNGDTSNCVALNAGVTATDGYVGRVAGDNSEAFANNYAIPISGLMDGITISTADATSQAAYGAARFAFGTPVADDASPWVWGAFPGYDLPTLYWQTSAPLGNGRVFSPYLVYNLTDLNNVRNDLTAYYRLMADIDAGSAWSPIGGDSNMFTGTFDGNGKTVTINGIAGSPSKTGLFGRIGADGTVKNLGVAGTIGSASMNTVGAVAGENNGLIENCYSSADVTAGTSNSQSGGIVGTNTGTIQNCWSSGVITNAGLGGLRGGIVGWQLSGSVEKCYSVADAEGLINELDAGDLLNSLDLTTGNPNTPPGVLTHGFYTAMGWVFGFDESNPWMMGLTDYPLPILWWQTAALPNPFGDGSAANPYRVQNLTDLNNVRNDLTAHYIVTADIDAGSSWSPIGTVSTPFTGTFDGGGHTVTVSGFTANVVGQTDNIGLFGALGAGGVIRDLLVEGSISYDESSGVTSCHFGGIVGDNYGTIQNCAVTASVTGTTNSSQFLFVGGVAGFNNNSGAIQNCYTEGDVSASNTVLLGYSYVGGIAGENDGSVSSCYATGSVSANASNQAYAGGIAGNNQADVSNCVALNTGVTASTTATMHSSGRVAGQNISGTLSNNYAIVISGLPNGTVGDTNGATIATPVTQANFTTAGFSFGSNDASPWVWGATYPILWWQ